MQLDDRAADRQTHAEAVRLGGEEGREDVGRRRRQTDAVSVTATSTSPVPAPVCTTTRREPLVAVGARLDAVEQQIEQHLLDLDAGRRATVGSAAASSRSRSTPWRSASPSTTRTDARTTSLRSTRCGLGSSLRSSSRRRRMISPARSASAPMHSTTSSSAAPSTALPARSRRAAAEGVVGDGAERLVDLVRQPGRHLAHGADAEHVREVGLVLRAPAPRRACGQ